VPIGCPQTPSREPEVVHPLLDEIFDTRTGEELSRDALNARLRAAQVIYLGEAHDESAHHRAQLDVLHRLVEMGKPPAVGFEIFGAGQTHLLAEYARRTDDADAWLRRAAGWTMHGDPNWGYYGALLQYARSQHLELFGIDLEQNLRQRLTRLGFEGLDAHDRAKLQSTGFDDPIYRKVMLEELEASHCGYGDQAFFARLYDTWIARNDAMARAIVSMLKEDSSRPIAIIVGAGHTRYGMGVVERVAHLSPGTRQLDIGLRSVTTDRVRAEEYYGVRPSAAPDYPPTHDLVWFTSYTPGRPTMEQRCTEAFE
jgi:uncharacterized iron-regulated protein